MSRALRFAWLALAAAALAPRLAAALHGPVLRGYDAIGHVSYVFFLDLYRSVPLADQGWSYFHPPLHYALGWLLAQHGDAERFVRGLLGLGGLASLGIAALAAASVRRGLPNAEGLALLAFASLAFLPVHLYASAMPGNELTASLLASAALLCHAGAPARGRWSRDLSTGALLGLALLTKYSATTAVLAILAQLGVRVVRGDPRAARARLLARAAVIGGLALVIAGPYYARNAKELGSPFPLAGQRPVVDAFEAGQPPGERGWLDLIRVSPRVLVDPDPEAPHMLHSIPGTTWAGVWVHLDPHEADLRPTAVRALLWLGIAPSALALLGLGASLRRALRDPRADADLLWTCLTGVGLAAYAAFAFRVPTFAALKALYLLNLSLAWAWFLARGVHALAARPALQRAAVGSLCAAFAFAAVAYTRGVGLPAGGVNVGMARVHAHFGEWEPARTLYRRELAAALRPAAEIEHGPRLNPFWLREMLAGVELESGRAGEARALYAESLALRAAAPQRPGNLSARSPFLLNRLAVASALVGDGDTALSLLDEAIAAAPYPEFQASRGALRASLGDRAGAERDLAAALAQAPRHPAALASLAELRAGDGSAEADALRREALRAADEAPRHYPYGVGDGRGLNTQLYMLVLESDGLGLYRPARARPRS